MMNSAPALSRRTFLRAAAAAPAAFAAAAGLPRVDYHVHLSRLVPLEKALEISSQRNVRFGIVEHAGTKEFPYPGMLNSDGDIKAYIARLDGKPVFKGIQAEGLNWMTAFSKDAVAQLDYVLSDALTMPWNGDPRVRIWTPAITIDDKQKFMDAYTDFNVQVISEEPIDILANPTFLPNAIEADYDALWTAARMKKIVDAAVKHRVAIEINSAYRIPHLRFLKMAKDAGAKFSFGSNIHTLDVGNVDFCLETAETLNLRPTDIFAAAPYGRKPIQIRKI